jgi:hypothetical protein
MTEAEWLAEQVEPHRMILSLRGTSVTRTKVGRRKLRLFACGCCRLIWPHLVGPRLCVAVEVAERFADGKATASELDKARKRADDRKPKTFVPDYPGAPADTAAAMAVATTEAKPLWAAFDMVVYPLPFGGYLGEPAEGQALLRDLLRDIFGNPFRPATFDPACRTDTAKLLAGGMYESRDFSAMPILADALQDAGCDSEDVLAHCRVPGPHGRGCWVVDLVLGRE